jgi:hypothetical protein
LNCKGETAAARAGLARGKRDGGGPSQQSDLRPAPVFVHDEISRRAAGAAFDGSCGRLSEWLD